MRDLDSTFGEAAVFKPPPRQNPPVKSDEWITLLCNFFHRSSSRDRTARARRRFKAIKLRSRTSAATFLDLAKMGPMHTGCVRCGRRRRGRLVTVYRDRSGGLPHAAHTVSLKDVKPVYPEVAQAARVQGAVVLEVVIDPTGGIREARVVRSIPLLDQAAIDAVEQWQFTPTRLNGRAVPVMMTVTVNFSLQ